MTRPTRSGTAMAAVVVATIGVGLWGQPATAASDKAFERIATVEVWRNDPAATRSDERVAEIVDATPDGNTLVYTDSAGEQVGFYDITSPSNPVGLGVFPVGGEPTSVATFRKGDTVYALVAVNTSPSFTNPTGKLLVIDITDPTNPALEMILDMGGQPDSVAISPNGTYAAVAIENERDEDVESPALTPEEGGLPQLPAGFLNVVDLSDWSVHKVEMTGLAKFGGDDPEPEFVDINNDDIAVVTLQENNAVVLVDLASKSVVKSIDAGNVLLRNIDTVEDDVIRLTDKLRRVREPDAVTWMGGDNGHRTNRHYNNPKPFFATANEGDLLGGSRGFTIFDGRGKVVYESYQSLEHRIVRHGHYPEARSENKGGEPEGIEWAEFDGHGYLFVGAERAGVTAVYDVDDPGKPQFVQILPTGLQPEGLKAIPGRGLFVVAAEADTPPDADAPNADNRLSGFRSMLSIYRLQESAPSYPTVVSANQPFRPWDKRSLECFHDKSCRDRPIPWGALSALAADRSDAHGLYAVSDSFYAEARIFAIDVGVSPAVIEEATTLVDGTGDPYPGLDPEGLVQRSDGSFWVVSEGSGSVDDPARPVTTTDRLLEVAADGTVLQVIGLPAEVNALQRRFGFEGVAVTGSVGVDEKVYVAFQREWVNDPPQHVRIGVYDPATGDWAFFLYPIDAPSTTFVNAWVGLSEIVSLGGGEFAVIERDNLIGEEAASEGGIKQICTFSVQGLTPGPQGGVFPILTKSAPCTNLLPALEAFGGPVMDKVEGLTVAADGEVYIVTDNDGVDDHPGETLLIDLGDAASVMPQPRFPRTP